MIQALLIGIYFAFMLFVMGNHIFNKKIKYNFRITMLHLGYIFIFTLIYQIDVSFKLIFIILLNFIYFKLLFNESITKTIYSVIIIYVINFISELLIYILDETLFYYYEIIKFLSENIIISNYLIIGLSTFIIFIFRDKLHSFIKSTRVYPTKYIIYILLGILLIPVIIASRNYGIQKFPEIQLIIEILLLIVLIFILYKILKQEGKIDSMRKQYTEETDYYKMTEGLLEEYRYILHENKNQLLVIKSMINDNPELEEYLNHLIDGRRNLKYEWVCDLKNIPIQGVKGLVNYKVSEMKKKNLNVEIYIDDEIGKIKVKNLTQKDQHELYSILGIFLDNALEASSVSEEKMVSIQCYKENEQIHIMIANTYVGSIDLNKIKELGYSSKGKNRGIGLPLVDKIVRTNSIYKNETELFDIFFVQHLYIQLPNNTQN